MTRRTPITRYRVLDITYKLTEELLSTPLSIPTVEPPSELAQIYYIISSNDLPDFTVAPAQKVFVACVYGGGKNTTTNNLTLYWKMYKNGTAIASSSFVVSAGYYWTLSSFFYDVKPGDALAICFWANGSGLNFDYSALAVAVTRLAIYPAKIGIYKNISFTISAYPTLTLGTPGVHTTSSLLPLHVDESLPSITASKSYLWLGTKSLGLFRIYMGDYTSANTAQYSTDATLRPYYRRNYVPTRISFTNIIPEGQL
ncbi:MAG: hypothetical protein QXK24_00230 [Ignisphaera sp.]